MTKAIEDTRVILLLFMCTFFTRTEREMVIPNMFTIWVIIIYIYGS